MSMLVICGTDEQDKLFFSFLAQVLIGKMREMLHFLPDPRPTLKASIIAAQFMSDAENVMRNTVDKERSYDMKKLPEDTEHFWTKLGRRLV